MAKAKLFEDFNGVTRAEWKEKVISDLKGADYNRKLVWRSEEGFEVEPLYMREDVDETIDPELSPVRVPVREKGPGGNIWMIRQDFTVGDDVNSLAERIQRAISRGAESIGIDLEYKKTDHKALIEELLPTIDPVQVPLHFIRSSDPVDLFGAFLSGLQENNISAKDVRGSLGADPIGRMVITGEPYGDAITNLTEAIRTALNEMPEFRIIHINAGYMHEGGSTLSMELGFGLSMAQHYIEFLTGEGLNASDILSSMQFNFATGPDYFPEIAKLRAARWLWKVICDSWSVEGEPSAMLIHSATAGWNQTYYDPHVNMLRSTTEAMSASLGGSDSITVRPYDMGRNDNKEFPLRAARNTQVILKEEAYLDRVADPGSGSYYIEALTGKIGEKAWQHFLETEDKGGFLKAFESGWIQKQVASQREKKQADAATRKRSILGVNQYPNFNELLKVQALEKPQPTTDTTYEPIVSFRIASELESLRMATENSGQRPRVYLLKFGNPAWRSARAMFAGNFFACAGYEIIDPLPFNSVEEGFSAAIKEKVQLVVLCSSDETYKEAAISAIASSGEDQLIVIAGYPTDDLESIISSGIENFIHMHSNLLGELKRFNKLLKIEDI